MVYLLQDLVGASIWRVTHVFLIGLAYGSAVLAVHADERTCSLQQTDGEGDCQQEQGKQMDAHERVSQIIKLPGSPSVRSPQSSVDSNGELRTGKALQRYFTGVNTADAREFETLVHPSSPKPDKPEKLGHAEERKLASLPPEIRNLLSEIEKQMVEIPGGRFFMGCDSVESSCAADEGPKHSVSIRSFRLGSYEVTFDQYDVYAVATGQEKPSDFGWGRGNRPVIHVSYEDATAYADWLTAQTGRTFRLPTEAEWEYAARAGATTAYSWGNAIGRNMANCNGCGSEWAGKTAPVGSFAPNGFGVFDMHGNVWEWVQDNFHPNYEGGPVDGSVWILTNSPRRILRGGAWFDTPWFLRVSHRNDWLQNKRNASIGFRIAQDL